MVACADGASSDSAPDAVTPDETAGAPAATAEQAFATARELEVRNARMPMPGIVTAGQPNEAQVAALLDSGVEHLISLRPVSEDGAGWEEAHSGEAGYRFDRLPISGADDLTRENVEAFAALMDESEGAPTLLYCASSNRVGALLALKAAWIDGVAPEQAIEQGLAAGLTRLEGPVRELLGIS